MLWTGACLYYHMCPKGKRIEVNIRSRTMKSEVASIGKNMHGALMLMSPPRSKSAASSNACY